MLQDTAAGSTVGYVGEEDDTALPRNDQELVQQLSDTACDLSCLVPATKLKLQLKTLSSDLNYFMFALSRYHSELGRRAHGWRHLLGDVLELAQKLVVIPLENWAG